MRKLEALSENALRRARAHLQSPPVGSKAAAARDFGIDLSLLAEQLALDPAARVERMLGMADSAEAMAGRAQKRK
ncbi:MAG: hypothetical protein NW208_16935 [Bryobacter sp.]|nr:hypothetical protein [Bryobacter sp.]